MFESLKTTKNLLAFSGGVDSTALFFMLLENSIDFDIAIVNYNIRAESKLEVAYAHELAKKYSKKIYLKDIIQIEKNNFESNARNIRYDFFDEIMGENGYEILITAHQLNDRFEWFLMQLSKGAGVATICGFEDISIWKGYKIARPLINTTRQKLLDFLKQKNIKYFEDSSNLDQKYKRNFFRHNFSNDFVNNFEDGIRRSFEYLSLDAQMLRQNTSIIAEKNELLVVAFMDEQMAVQALDMELKKRGVLISKNTRQEILKQKQITISSKFCVAIEANLAWICPVCESVMDKKFKECARVAKIPQNIRPYLKKILGDCDEVKKFIGDLHAGRRLFLDK